MADNPFTASVALDRAAVAQAHPEITRGARWFWWIAGLSVVNTVMIHSGGDINFVIGLGFTMMADAVFQSYKVIAFGIDAVALGVIFGLGWFAGKGHLWAFVVGAVLYGLDALIYVYFQDWMSVAFHGLALFYIIKGAGALRTALRAAAQPAPPSVQPAAG